MPLIIIRTTVDVTEADRLPLLEDCSRTLAKQTGKPESYVMTILEPVAGMTMAGTAEPCCLVEIRGVGSFTPKQTAAMSNAFCALIQERLRISTSRIYLNFTGFDGTMWGFDGATFG